MCGAASYSELRSELGPIEYKRFTKRVRRIWKNMMNALDLDQLQAHPGVDRRASHGPG